MKKIITIPYDVYERLSKHNDNCTNSGPLKTDLTADSSLSDSGVESVTSRDIETRLTEILNSVLPFDKKRLLYTNLLRKFIDINKVYVDEPDKSPTNSFDPSSILTSILPKTVIKKGIGFLNYLELSLSITWDKNSGEVSL